jgi:hypothetical protein
LPATRYADLVSTAPNLAQDAARFEIVLGPVGGVFRWFVEEVIGSHAMKAHIYDRALRLDVEGVGSTEAEALKRAWTAWEARARLSRAVVADHPTYP